MLISANQINLKTADIITEIGTIGDMMPNDALTKITRSNEERLKLYSDMVEKAIRELNNDLAKADHPILKLTTISRHEGYGIALHELGADTTKLGKLVEVEAKKIEPAIRKLFK